MAVTVLPINTMSESIKQAVRSTSTCSDVTVLSLQTLLRGLPKVPEKPVRRATKTTKEATTTTSRARAATRTTKARTSTDVTLRIVDQDGATLSPQEKLVLATEVFNTTLKTLTDASKTATTRRPAAVSETVSVKSGRTNGSVVDKGAAATAECARLALATLRALKTETQSSNDYPNMQLEQGACILAGKMITLGLNEMACKELRALKRRIQQYLDARAVGERTGSTKDNAEEDTGKERMSDLLTFSNIAHAESVYSLLVPYHANVMRLLAADRKSSTTARLISFLQLVDPSSPASVILAAMESGNLTSEKAALQLQLLSNTILSLCPSKSMSTDEATAKDSLQPISILSLQLLSLEIRALSWKLSGHVCQETKELVDPLLRYLGSFSHRSKSVEKSEFGAIFKTITRIQTTMAEVKKQRQENKDITASARIMTVLGQLALDAGCFEESLKLFNKAVIPFFNAQSLALATARCKIAAVYFQGLKGSQKFAEGALKAISEASTALGMQLRGNVSDLDELLVEAARLKKLALAWFGDAMGKEDNTEKDEIASNMREYLQAFLRLLWRYVGRPPAEECDEKELQLYKSRITMSKNIILAGVDSVVAIGRLSIMSQKPSWADMLPILADSHRLLTSVESADGVDSDPAFAEHVNIALVKLSNLFWSRFVKEKEAGQGYRELMPLLKQSTSLLGTCPMTHRKSAFAALKYERTAHVYLDASKYDDAEHAFRSSILEYVDAGVLEDVAKVSAGDSPHIIEYDSKSSAFAFTRVLSAFLKLKLRKKGSKSSSPLIYDDERLDSRSRGTLIEWQMRLLCDLRSYASSDEGFRAVFNPVVHLVMDLYPSNAHHIRRARVLLFALRFSLEHPPCMSAELTNKVLEEAAQVLNYGNGVGLDPDMTSFETHITNSLRVIIGFHHGKIDESELNDTLSSWSAIIRQCADAESLSHSITDVDYWVLQLKALVDYTEIHSLWKTQLSVLELILRVVEIMKSGDFSDAISILARLVIQHCHLGHCQKAGDLLARGEQYVDHSQTSIIAKIAYQLARVEYLLETGDIEKADHVLATARVLYEKGRDTEELKNLTGLAKISLERLVADAAFIHSRLSTAQGSMTQALYFAKLAVRLNCRIWAKVEKLAQKKQARVLPSPPASDVEVVTDGVAQIDLSQNEMSSNSSTTYVQGAPFWPHLGSHHSSLLNLATLSAHHGLFQDAIYYGEQALKIDRTLDANVRMIAAQTQLGSYRIIGGHLSEGQELLAAASDSSKQLQTSVESVALHLALASFYESQEQHEKALCVLREADKLITSLIASDAVPSLVGPNVAVLDEKMAKLQVRSSRKPAATPAPATPARRTRAASSAAAPRTTKKATASKAPAPEIQSSTLLRLRSLILRQQADCLRALRDFDGSAQSLIEARQCATARESKVSVEIGESEHLLADAIRHFASHAVYCVLPESTISLPSLTSPVKGGEQVTPASVKPTAAKKTRTPARTTRTKAQKASEDFVMMLSKANDCLMGVFSDATVLGSTLESHAASRLMSRISMLSHATTPGGSATWVQSPANMNEIGRVGAFARERMAIDFDRKLSDFGDPLLWPTSVPQNDEISGDICSNFAEKYVDILPENWNVLSLSLSADGSEFYVSRLQRNRSPFLLRLPLRRGNSEEDEEEQFTFEDGKEEMQELIKLANQSAHAAKAQTTKQMKKEWWKNREDLDRRMESLLQNVENVWFGGFRGIFSPLARNSDAFGRFVDAFQSILDKHLPSRQKGGKASTPRLVLHQNVLELFIGLRDLEDQEEPDDILMDLLYFVVDILQFQGERNAYDEIDFDMMVVDTLDALRGYHEAAREDVAADSPRHTVLVLDKALHLFPWESLPCLQGFPVCRVPSLECLRDRVLQFRGSQAGATIQHTSGTYLLNPTSDLRSTQESFEPGLSRLESWTGMVNREPSEEEFRSALETKDLFLYFGHGSGAQYIRGRTVKRLTKCAVAFLMGCSSGTLTEAGEYEPYGTPMNYLQAGSPALVATLWDVTDKDIDRFATSTFGSWGLLDRKGKSSRESPNSLDAAVAGARASCVLKYLNGAAPVVYGVPVFLE